MIQIKKILVDSNKRPLYEKNEVLDHTLNTTVSNKRMLKKKLGSEFSNFYKKNHIYDEISSFCRVFTSV